MDNNLLVETLPALKEGERRVFYVEVGNMPNHKVQEFIADMHQKISELNEPCFIVPMRNGEKSVIIGKE